MYKLCTRILYFSLNPNCTHIVLLCHSQVQYTLSVVVGYTNGKQALIIPYF